MATVTEITALRLLLNDVDGVTYEDDTLAAAIDAAGSVKSAAAELWRIKAAGYAELVNVSESGSSRSLGDLHKNALNMAAAFDAEAAEDTTVATGIRIRRISRT